MVKLNKITTKVGDNGTTNLAGTNEKYPKSSELFELLGTLDECNSVLGLAVAAQKSLNSFAMLELLHRLQQQLFDVGADVATVAGNKTLKITTYDIHILEQDIELYNKQLKPLNSFILPSGNFTTCYLHLARSVCRRAERCAWYLFEEEANVSKEVCVFLNRLSDLLFILARITNEKVETLWEPGKYATN